MKYVKGPDFPGGGTIMGKQGIRDAYRSGRGSVKVRAKAHVEPLKGGKDAIIVTELPFMVKKGGEGGLIAKIADLVRDKKITGISDLRDESDRNGMRLVIELKRGGDPAQVVLNQLYKRTADAAGLRHQHGRAGRRRTEDAQPARAGRPLRRPPEGGHHPPHPAPAGPRRGARPHPRGAADRPRESRRGHQADPRLQGPGHRPRRPDQEVQAEPRAGPGDPRHAPAAPHRPRGRQDQDRARRAHQADQGAPRDPRRREEGARPGQDRAQGDRRALRRRPPHRDHRRRGRARHRGRDRRPADGRLDHRLRLREADPARRPTASSAAAAGA